MAWLGVVLLSLGAVLWLLGALFTIQHWPMTGMLFLFSAMLGCTGLLMLMVKVLRYPPFKDFLDS